jgi:hypothetical protein
MDIWLLLVLRIATSPLHQMFENMSVTAGIKVFCITLVGTDNGVIQNRSCLF